jgi:hypothetical protein
MKKWYCSRSVVIVNAWFLNASFRPYALHVASCCFDSLFRHVSVDVTRLGKVKDDMLKCVKVLLSSHIGAEEVFASLPHLAGAHLQSGRLMDFS